MLVSDSRVENSTRAVSQLVQRAPIDSIASEIGTVESEITEMTDKKTSRQPKRGPQREQPVERGAAARGENVFEERTSANSTVRLEDLQQNFASPVPSCRRRL